MPEAMGGSIMESRTTLWIMLGCMEAGVTPHEDLTESIENKRHLYSIFNP